MKILKYIVDDSLIYKFDPVTAKKYLKETSFTHGYSDNALAQDDDYPTGNILMGDRYKKTGYYNKLTSFNVNWVPDTSDWKWDVFGACYGMESKDSYHDSLKDKKVTDRGNLTNRVFRHMKDTKPKAIPKDLRALGNDIFPDTDAWGNPTSYTAGADTEEPDQKSMNKNIKQAVKDVVNKIEEKLK